MLIFGITKIISGVVAGLAGGFAVRRRLGSGGRLCRRNGIASRYD